MATRHTDLELAAVFERAPALVEAVVAGARPGSSTEDILDRARVCLHALSEPEQVAVLNAHPRIGAGLLSTASRREQGPGADPVLETELASLNDEYEYRFGFRFVVFVNGRSKREIAPVLRARLGATRAEELATALEEFLAITRARLEARR